MIVYSFFYCLFSMHLAHTYSIQFIQIDRTFAEIYILNENDKNKNKNKKKEKKKEKKKKKETKNSIATILILIIIIERLMCINT